MITSLLNEYRDNPEALEAIRLINYTKNSVFLTGKAGTGKSTLLRNITSHLNRNFIIVAPTGVAAINVGGQTINSFFRIAPRPYLPDDKDIEYLENKQEILKNLDLIIIDEVSMVRADLMNAIDLSLRKNLKSSKPFAGIQLLMIGDLFQLPPVTDSKKLNEIEILNNYKTPYFFSSKAFEKGLHYYIVELQKVYRQSDEKFIHLLNSVRENNATNQDLINLNSRYNLEYEPAFDSDEITLATTKVIVSDINSLRLNSIQSVEFEFEAFLTGTFTKDGSSSKLPTDKILLLKVGAQVMFIKNDTGDRRRWVNGTLGKIISIDDDEITIFVSSKKSNYTIERVTWEDIEYVWNKKEEKIEQKVVGTFTQFPLQLAWAVTIHKSQGQTFDKTIINLGNGAFTTGQTYVALSRCRTFEGITLKTKIRQKDIMVDRRIQDFLKVNKQQELINEKKDSIINGIEDDLKNNNLTSHSFSSENQLLLEKIANINKNLNFLQSELNVKNKEISRISLEKKNADANILELNNNINTYVEILNNGSQKLAFNNKISAYLWGLCIAFAILSIFTLYKQVYQPKLKEKYRISTNEAFSQYLLSLKSDRCEKENAGARTVLIDDLNDDGNLDGIVIAIFDGVNCKNSSETILYVYNLKMGFNYPPSKLTLSRKNKSIVSFRGIENGQLIFDKWNLKDYDQKEFNFNKIDKFHLRMFISIKNDSLDLNIRKY